MVLLYQKIVNILLLLNFILFTVQISASTKLPSTKLKEKMDMENSLERYLLSSDSDSRDQTSTTVLNGESAETTTITEIFLSSNKPTTNPTTTSEKPITVDQTSTELPTGESSKRTTTMDIFLSSTTGTNIDNMNQTTTNPSSTTKKEIPPPPYWFWISLGAAILLFLVLLFLGIFALIWRILHGETVKDIFK